MNAKNDRIPYVPFAMILRQQSYTISISLTCPPIFPCLTILLGKRSFIHFDNATFCRFGISFAQLLHAKLQQPERAGMEKKSSHPPLTELTCCYVVPLCCPQYCGVQPGSSDIK